MASTASEVWLPADQTSSTQRRALIFFTSGNPGLIAFYTDFLTYVRGLLDESGRKQGVNGSGTAYDIYGRNLLGFSDEEHEPFSEENPPCNLEDQIQAMYDALASRRAAHTDGSQRPYDFVILAGHSVGAYITVEIFHRHLKNPERAPHLHLRHGILLFPTLTDIALSPSGRRLCLLQRVPGADAGAHLVARAALWPFSEPLLRWFIFNVMGFTETAADVTARWLKSRDGVWEALYMGQAEMSTIGEERWEEELWEVATEDGDDAAAAAAAGVGEKGASSVPKFFMFYGREDHWVANHIRDAFIERRREHGERGGRTRIVVDEGDMPHAFCTREASSWTVARKVAGWVDDIERGLKGETQGG